MLVYHGHEKEMEEECKTFKSEAQNISKIQHRGIADTLNIWRENETIYFSMEYIEGFHLPNPATPNWKAMAWTDVKEIAKTLLEALEKGYETGLCHGDIKPSNVIIHEKTEMPVLINFGRTQFLEPKQRDQFFDIYCWAIVVVGMLAETNAQYSKKSLKKCLSSDVPNSIRSLLANCLSSNPKKRPKSIKVILKRLEKGKKSFTKTIFAIGAVAIIGVIGAIGVAEINLTPIWESLLEQIEQFQHSNPEENEPLITPDARRINSLFSECSNGDLEACKEIADLYRLGSEQNNELAASFYRKACDLGDAESCFQLAVMYEEGTGVYRNFVDAVRFYEIACSFGDTNSCFRVGNIYEHGINEVYRNEWKAIEFYRLACDGGDSRACSRLDELDPDDDEIAFAHPEPIIDEVEPERRGVSITSSIQVSRPLTRASLRNALRQRNRDVERCYQRALAHDPTLGGPLKIEFTINQEGRTQDIELTSNELNEQVGNCVLQRVEHWRFDRPPSNWSVEKPYFLHGRN